MGKVEVPQDGGAIYAVHAYYFGGGSDGWTFANDRAFGRANAEFERLANSAGVLEVWLTRTDDSNGPKFVARRGRLAEGSPMVDIPFAAEMLPDPTEPE
jgi:hypothetical protein